MKPFFIKIILTFCLLSVYNYADSQIGVTGGINLSSMRSSLKLNWKNTYEVGFHIGAFYDYHLSNSFMFQPSIILLNESSRRFILGGPDNTGGYKDSFKSYGCFIPLVFSYKFPINLDSRFLVDLGPYSSIGLWGEHDENIDIQKKRPNLYKDYMNRFDYGLIIGVGYGTKNINYSLRLKQGLRNLNISSDKPSTILLSVGYKF